MRGASHLVAVRLTAALEKATLFSLAEWTLIHKLRSISLLLRSVIVASLFLAFLDIVVTRQAILPNTEFFTMGLVAGLTMAAWLLRRGGILFGTIVLGTCFINVFALGNVAKFGSRIFSVYSTHALYLAPLCVLNAIIFRPRPALILNGLMFVVLLGAAAAAFVSPPIADNPVLIVRVAVVIILEALFLAAVYLALDAFMKVRGQLTEAVRLLRTLELHDETSRESERIRNQITRFHRIGTIEAMSTSLAHELNQPIGAALSFVQAVGRWLGRDPPAVDEALAATIGAATQLERVVAVMSDIRKMSTLASSQPELIDVGLHIRGILDLMHGECREAGVSVGYAEQDDPASRMAEVRIEEIGQVVLNLVRNAIEAFLPDGAEHRIDVALISRGQGWLEIRVSDNGPGIPSSQLALVFDPFFTTKGNGSGLGLSICRSIAERHGGSLCITNPPGGGALAVFAFPIAVAPE